MGLPVLKIVRYYISRSIDAARKAADVSIIAPRCHSLEHPLEHKQALIEKKDDNDS